MTKMTDLIEIILILLCVAILIFLRRYVEKAKDECQFLLEQHNHMAAWSCHLRAENEQLKSRNQELEEACRQAKAKIEKLEKDQEIRWAWNEKRNCWMPTNVTGKVLMQKVPFPILAVEQKDPKTGG